MALMSHPHPTALVAMRMPLPLELRILEAEHAVEAAEHLSQIAGRRLDSHPSEATLRSARWAHEDLRDALDRLEELRAEVRGA